MVSRVYLSGLENVRQEFFYKITRRKYFCILGEIVLFLMNFLVCFDTLKNIAKVICFW